MGFVNWSKTPIYNTFSTSFNFQATSLSWLSPNTRERVDSYNADSDHNGWLENSNDQGDDEFAKLMGLDLSRYKVQKNIVVNCITDMNNKTHSEIETVLQCPKYSVHEKDYEGSKILTVKDKDGTVVAEKIMGLDGNTRKIIYENLSDGKNKLTVTEIYDTYNPETNADDIYDFAFFDDKAKLIGKDSVKTKMYQLNGKEVDSSCVKFDKENNSYTVNDNKTGNVFIFTP